MTTMNSASANAQDAHVVKTERMKIMNLKKIRTALEAALVKWDYETCYENHQYGSELVVRVWSADDDVMMVYRIPSRGAGSVYAVYDDDKKNNYEYSVPAESVYNKLISKLAEWGIEYHDDI